MTAITNADTVRTVTMEPAMIRKLANAAKKATDWTQERNRLIKEAHEAGAGYREIGRAVGLSHVGVKGIVEGYTIMHIHGTLMADHDQPAGWAPTGPIADEELPEMERRCVEAGLGVTGPRLVADLRMARAEVKRLLLLDGDDNVPRLHT